MDVILMQDLDNLGQMGETVTVARGYARNFLIPKGMAVVASPGNENMVAEHVRLAAKRDDLRKSSAEQLAEQLGELSCTLTVQAGEDDKLFGSVTARDITGALAEQGYEFEAKQVGLDEPIKQLGVYTVPVKLHADVSVETKVWVVKA